MRYTLTFPESRFETMCAHLAPLAGVHDVERGAYLLCRLSTAANETRLIVRDVIPVAQEDILEQSATHMKIASISYRRAMKWAHLRKSAFVFVHSHPSGSPAHSLQDDAEEAKLFATAHARIGHVDVHGSLIFSDGAVSAARVWLGQGTTAPIERVRIIGRRFEFGFFDHDKTPPPVFFDRQVRAFGPDIQRLMSRLTVGVVGAGGTGSAVIEQLIRLGVGKIIVADGEAFEATNVNRVYGARVSDDGIPKVEIVERHADLIGLGTTIDSLVGSIAYKDQLSAFRDCDLIFGCTDDEWGRSLLSRFAYYYAIPVFDMGVKIDSEEGVIQSIQGRVTTLMPGTACLHCRGRISANRARIEALRALNPEEAAAQIEEGYIPELGDPAPAVIPFTTTIAASAIMEMLHRLSGCFGEDRVSSEVIHLLDQTNTRTNSKPSRPECYCGDAEYWGRADVRPFLDSVWPA